MPRRLLVRRRWIRGWCWLCAFSNVCCVFMPEQNLNSTRCMSLSFGGICLGSKFLPLPSMGITNTPSGRLWCLASGKVLLCWENPVRNVFYNVIRGFNVKVRSLFTLTSIHCNNCWAQFAFANFFTTKANSVVVSPVYVHSLQSMAVAPKKYVWSTVWSSARRAGGRACRMAKPFGVFVRVYRIRPVLKDLFLFLTSHIWHGDMDQNLLLNWACARGFAVACRVRELGCAARWGVSCNFCQSL